MATPAAAMDLIEMNKLIAIPLEGSINLPDGRELRLTSWTPTATIDGATTVQISAYIVRV